ncbi:MAG: YcaO-like family protein [Rhizobiales bacterium]|nr:YcaO-like family protein [Hyphomicrobiales bacterium]
MQACIFEAIERSSAVFSNKVMVVRAAAADLGDQAIDPMQLLLISGRQYHERPEWNLRVTADHRLPRKFDPLHPAAWVPARGLHGGQDVLMPAAYVYLGYPDALTEGFTIPDSSGLACGQSREDALERALLELVERDAVAIWWYGRVRRPLLALDPERTGLARDVAAWVSRHGRQFWILDLTHDLGVPVAAAMSCENDGSDFSIGFGAGYETDEATRAAAGELIQFEATKKLREGNEAPADWVTWCASARVGDHPHLLPAREATPVPIGSGPVQARLAAAGLPAFAVEFPAGGAESVVRAIVPGLRSIWPRFAPGRLYDVPARLGWHERILSEGEMNPISILY